MVVIRQSPLGHKIGPTFADNPEWATLFLAPEGSVKPFRRQSFLDTPDVNQAAVTMLQRQRHEPSRLRPPSNVRERCPDPARLNRRLASTSFDGMREENCGPRLVFLLPLSTCASWTRYVWLVGSSRLSSGGEF